MADKKKWGQLVTESCLGTLKVPVRATEAGQQNSELETVGKCKSYLWILKRSKPFLKGNCTNTGKLVTDRERSRMLQDEAQELDIVASRWICHQWILQNKP